MTTDDFGPELTAFALNDPSLTDAQNQAIRERLAADPAARLMVEETAFLARHLEASLAVNVEPVEDSAMGHTVAATLEKKRNKTIVPWWAAALAACVIVGLGFAVTKRNAAFHAQLGRGAMRNETPLKDKTHGVLVDGSDSMVVSGSIDSGAAGSATVEVVPFEQLGGVVIRGRSQKDVEAMKASIASGQYQMPLAPSKPMPAPTFGPPGAGNFNGGFGGGGIPQGPNGGFGGMSFQGGGGWPELASYSKNLATGTASTPAWAKDQKPEGPEQVALGAARGGMGANTPAVQLQILLARKKNILQGGLGAEHEKVKAVDAEIAFVQALEQRKQHDVNGFPQLVENPFTEVKGEAALSTFGVDVDTASYSIVRNYLNHNSLPPANAVRLEEMVNYFPYKDAPPEGNDPFAVRVEMAECPWQPKHRLARIALKAKPIDNAKRPKSNLVFLIDVSGSMDGPNRLPLVKASMKLLVGQLGENDRVALVVYAGASGLVLDSTNCGNKETILKALDNLTPGGSTNGAGGIQLAYDIAVKNFVEKGTNRVILCTDGDWNVGTTSTTALIQLIEEKRKTGVFLSVFGFGMGNLRDEMMVQLAGKGNGNYAYIDTIAEAKKSLVEQVAGTLVTVAKDVKIQIEFNPARVASYRLLGYEKRILAAEDFHDDKKDAGEMGAGHVVTTLYELIPAGVAAAEPKVDGLRYQPKVEAPKAPAANDTAKEAFVLKLRHKMPDKDESTLREIPVPDDAKPRAKASDDFQFASAVAAFAMLLKDSPYKAGANYALVEELAAASMTNDPGAYRAEFLQLVKKAKVLAGVK